MNWEKIWNNVISWCSTKGLRLLEAVLVLIVGIIIVKLLVKALRATLNKTKLEKVVAHFLVNVTKFLLYLMVLYIFASMIGIPMTGFIAIISAGGLAVSLALQGSLSNLANGVVLICTKPFNENDFVEIDGQSGSVKEIKMMYTILNTPDNKSVIIPNKTVVESKIVNYSANDTRKVVFSFDVAYNSDVEKVKAIINSVIINHELVLLEPTPFIALKTLGESNITFMASCWCKSQDYWTVYYDVIDEVFNEFKRENISIAYNQLEVRMRTDEEILPYKNDVIQDRIEEKKKKLKEDKLRKEELANQIELFPGIVIRKHRKKQPKEKVESATTDNTQTKKEHKNKAKSKKED